MLTSRGGSRTRGAPCGNRSGWVLCAASSASGGRCALARHGRRDVGRREQGEVGVVVRVVVPAEERREPAAGVQFAGEAARVVGLVLQRLDCDSLKLGHRRRAGG